LISVFDFIAQDSAYRASAFVDQLDDLIGALERHPMLGRIPRHQKLREDGYRVLIIKSYLVFYIVRGREIEVHRVVHGSRNLDHLI
jgi:plasmid stabilization system protein ParE